MRTLLIGGAGLLGSTLVPLLEKAGHEVAICDNFTGSIKFRLPKETKVFAADATNVLALSHVFSIFKPEVIYVCLNYHFPPESIYKPFDETRNILLSTNAICALLDKSIKSVVYCSSSEVYGGPEPRRPLNEFRDIAMSATHRGTAYRMSEQLLKFRCEELGVRLSIARIFDMYGERIKFTPITGKINFLIDSFLRSEQIGLVGSKKSRDFIHVDDVASALVWLPRIEFHGVVNIGTGVGTSLVKICASLKEVMDIPYLPLAVPDRSLESFSAVADMDYFNSMVPQWKPKHNVMDDLPGLVEFRRKEVLYYSPENSAQILMQQREG